MACPFIPDDDLAVAAQCLLDRHAASFGRILAPPVPIQEIVELTLGLDIDWTDGPPFDRVPDEPRVLAAVQASASGRKLLMNTRHRAFFATYHGTMEFSMAHEAAHAVLHLPACPTGQLSLALPNDPIVYCRSNKTDRQEIQAERFASYLLMPEHLLHGQIADQSITARRQIEDLARTFAVSYTAMKIRLETLDLAVVDARGRVAQGRAAAANQASLLHD